jgi:hypothetical protein
MMKRLLFLLLFPLILLGQGQNFPSGGGGFPVTTAVTVNSGGSISTTGTGTIAATSACQPNASTICPAAPPYNISFDGKACEGTRVSWLITSTTVTVDGTICKFTAADTGKLAFGVNCANGVLTCVAGTVIRPLGVMTFVNSTTATVAGNSTAACNTAQCQFWWFTDDRTKWCCGAGTVDNAFQNAIACVSVQNPAGISPIPFGLFNTAPITCRTTVPGDLVANLDSGNSVWGQGMANTVFLLPPDTNFANCTAAGNTCLWAGTSGGGNFTIHGGGFGLTGNHAVKIWSPQQNASFFNNISLTEFASGDTGVTWGALFLFSNEYMGIYVDQFGSFPCELNGVNVILSYYSCGNSRQVPMTIDGAGTVAHINNGYIQATNGTIGVDIGAGASNVSVFSEQDNSYGAVNGGGTHIYIEPGSIAHYSQWLNAPSGALRGFQLGNTAKLYLRDSVAGGTTNAIGTNTVAMTTGAFYDLGGNSYSGGLESTLIPTCTFTSGGGTTPSCALQAGSTNEKGVIIATTGTGAPSSAGTVTLTFAGTFAGAGAATPACVYNVDNSGTAWGNEAGTQVSTQSTTAPVVAWFNVNSVVATALTVSSPYRIDYTCTPR